MLLFLHLFVVLPPDEFQDSFHIALNNSQPTTALARLWCLCLGMRMFVEMLDNAKNSAVNGGSKTTSLKIMSDVI